MQNCVKFYILVSNSSIIICVTAHVAVTLIRKQLMKSVVVVLHHTRTTIVITSPYRNDYIKMFIVYRFDCGSGCFWITLPKYIYMYVGGSQDLRVRVFTI